jgi:hypothetical protein
LKVKLYQNVKQRSVDAGSDVDDGDDDDDDDDIQYLLTEIQQPYCKTYHILKNYERKQNFFCVSQLQPRPNYRD